MKKKKKTAGKSIQKHYYYNEHDDNQVEALRTRRKKRRMKKHIKRLLQLMIFVLVVMFFVSPFSRVQHIEVSGQVFLKEESILEKAKVSEDSLHLLTYPYFIEKKLENMPMLASCEVSRGIFSTIKINVVEREIIAYRFNEGVLTIVDDAGNIIDTDASHLTDVQQKPRLMNFDNPEILKSFCKELSKVPEHTISLMSDIVFSPDEPYDKTRVLIDMSDGKKVYVRIEDMASELQYYQEILSQQPNACIYDIYGNKVYASPCE